MEFPSGELTSLSSSVQNRLGFLLKLVFWGGGDTDCLRCIMLDSGVCRWPSLSLIGRRSLGAWPLRLCRFGSLRSTLVSVNKGKPSGTCSNSAPQTHQFWPRAAMSVTWCRSRGAWSLWKRHLSCDIFSTDVAALLEFGRFWASNNKPEGGSGAARGGAKGLGHQNQV